MFLAQIIALLYIATAHSFNKITLILHNEMLVSVPLNQLALSTSTFFGAFGKILGCYLEAYNILQVLSLLFLLNLLCVFFCTYTSQAEIFLFFRTLQGFLAGIQGSISIALLSEKDSYTFFTGASSFVSCCTVFLLPLLKIKQAIGIILGTNFLGFLLCFLFSFRKLQVKNLNIIHKVIFSCIKNPYIWFLALLLGFVLALPLYWIGLQKSFLMEVGFSRGFAVFLSGLPFLFSLVLSLIKSLHKKWFAFFFGCFGLILRGINSPLALICSNCLLYGCFTCLSPVIQKKVSQIVENKSVVSSYFFAMRSACTAFSLFFLHRLENHVISILFFFILVCLAILDKIY